jgi:hypothetical protein
MKSGIGPTDTNLSGRRKFPEKRIIDSLTQGSNKFLLVGSLFSDRCGWNSVEKVYVTYSCVVSLGLYVLLK